MKNTLLKITKPLPELHRRIFGEVNEQASKLGLSPLVVGAAARDLIFEYVYDATIERKTGDLDFAIAVSGWDEYEQLRAALIESGVFRFDRLAHQRLWMRDPFPAMMIDIVPFGGPENPPGRISFPPDDDFVMRTIGLPEADRHSVTIDIGDDFHLRSASLAGLAMLKFGAFDDRPNVRQRDVEDIYFIASNYLSAGNEDRLYDEDADLLEEAGFDLRSCGGRLLGRDIGKMVEQELEDVIRGWIGEGAQTDKYEKFTGVLLNRSFEREEMRTRVVNLVSEIWKGIEEGRKIPGHQNY